MLTLVALALLPVRPTPALALRGLGGGALVEPRSFTSRNGLLDLTLVQKPDLTTVAGQQVQDVWTYHVGENGPPNYSGPTLYMKPGDTLRLKIVNQLPPSIPPKNTNTLIPVPTLTNLHTHGLHVSPLGNADNILITIPPDGASNQYEIKIPKNHPQGTYWYHPHVHYFAREQLLRGIAGFLIIGRPDGGAPQLAGIKQRLMMLQYSVIQPLVGGPPAMARTASFPGAPPLVHFTVNGQENPVVDIRPGESQLWNLCNASSNGYFYLRIKGVGDTADQPMVAVAEDGNPFLSPVTYSPTQPLLIAPGARFSVLVQGPPAGTYELEMVPWNDGFVWWPTSPKAVFLGDPLPQARTIATIVSGGTAVRPKPIPPRLSPPANYFEPLDRQPVAFRRAVEYGAQFEGPPDNPTNVIFLINGAPFPRNPVFQPRVNTVEEWVLSNTTIDDHPFHQHQNDFQVLSVDDTTDPTRSFSTPLPWVQDIIHLPAAVRIDPNGQLLRASTVVARIRARDFLGTYVQHCHRVDHEDRGQMALINVIPETPVYAVGAGRGMPPAVKFYNGLNNQPAFQTFVFSPTFLGGVRVAVGDVNQDTYPDVLVVPGPGGPSRVRVLSGKERFSKQLFDVRAFDQSFSGGLNVAAGDMNADGYDDMIVAPGGGAPPEVRIFSGKDGALLGSFLAYEPEFLGGVSLASAMVQPTGRYSVITGPGPGRAPEVRVFDVDWFDERIKAAAADAACKCKKGQCACGETSCGCSAGKCECSKKPLTKVAVSGVGLKPLFLTASAMVYEEKFQGGVNVGTGHLNGQNGGFASILTGPASDHSPTVKTFVVVAPRHDQMGGKEGPRLVEYSGFEAFPSSFNTGVWVSSISTPNGADLLVSPGQGQPPLLTRFKFQPFPQDDPRTRPVPGTFLPVASFNAFQAAGGGGGAVVGGR